MGKCKHKAGTDFYPNHSFKHCELFQETDRKTDRPGHRKVTLSIRSLANRRICNIKCILNILEKPCNIFNLEGIKSNTYDAQHFWHLRSPNYIHILCVCYWRCSLPMARSVRLLVVRSDCQFSKKV